AKESEQSALQNMKSWMVGLSKLKLDSSRRAYRVFPRNLHCDQDGNTATFRFSLSSGSYATVLLRELVDFEDMSLANKNTN
ncbi:MAG: tRNA pseudouridine(13) synthase TruD, partial [Kangiellaceae bacterium]